MEGQRPSHKDRTCLTHPCLVLAKAVPVLPAAPPVPNHRSSAAAALAPRVSSRADMGLCQGTVSPLPSQGCPRLAGPPREALQQPKWPQHPKSSLRLGGARWWSAEGSRDHAPVLPLLPLGLSCARHRTSPAWLEDDGHTRMRHSSLERSTKGCGVPSFPAVNLQQCPCAAQHCLDPSSPM